MSVPSLIFPDEFDEYTWELESKGCFSEARLEFQGRCYRLSFYDRARLGQEIDEELRRGGLFFEPNLVVVPAVTRQNMEKAAAKLVEQGNLGSMVSGVVRQCPEKHCTRSATRASAAATASDRPTVNQ
jgi:hypothetical protein